MSLNYLLHRHQVSLLHAASAATVDIRRTHEAFAKEYARRADAMSKALGASTAPISGMAR